MTAPTVPIYAAALTHPGGRKTNEDAIYACKSVEAQHLTARGYLYIVADGTGGQEGGQTASAMAAAIISERFYDDNAPDIEMSLRTAVQTAHEALHQLSERVTTWSKMSTTLVAAVVQGGYLYVAHVGDSRAYLVRDGQARLLTRDHVWLEDDENYGSLMRWLGGGRATVEVDTAKLALKEGDKVLLCSDGLTNVVDREDLQNVIVRPSPQSAATQLVELANRRGTSDNVSVAVIQYGGDAPKAQRPAWILPAVVAGAVLLVVLGVGLVFASRDTDKNGLSGVSAGGTITPTLAQRIDGGPIATSTPTPTWIAPVATDATRQPTSTPRSETPTPLPTPTRRPGGGATPTVASAITPDPSPTATPESAAPPPPSGGDSPTQPPTRP